MSIHPPRTGYEQHPGEFRFSSLRIPPDAVLPPPIRKLSAELAGHHGKWREAKERHTELATDQARRAAEQADAVLLGEAVRADKPDPGPVNVKALEDALEAAQQTMARHEAAGRLIAQDIDAKLTAAADKGTTEARAQIDAARTDHADALAALEAARQALVTNTAALAYWQQVTADGQTRWKGRVDGRGSSIVAADGQHVRLEPFDQLSASIRAEADRLARAVHTPAEVPAA